MRLCKTPYKKFEQNIGAGRLRNIKIVSMAPWHLKEIVALEREIQPEPWSEKMFLDEVHKKSSLNLVAVAGSGVMGYLCATTVVDELHILNIGVAPFCRRRGIGYNLLTKAIAKARRRGVHRVLLEVRETNTGAISLYEKVGFVKVGIRPGYYTTNCGKEGALLMTKNLKTVI